MELNKETFSRLKFIGKIQKGEKINVRYMYVQPAGLFTQISRAFIYPDNRINTLNFLQDTITRVFEIITVYEKSSKQIEKTMCFNLIKDLQNSKAGITNLKETYIHDVKFSCDIDTLVQVIDTKLIEIEPNFPTEQY